jgi:hypothetical protein
MAIIENGVMALKNTMLSLVDVRHLVKALDEVSLRTLQITRMQQL